jgi:glycosyltransferase involved in cell wall biosynthesis
MKDIAIVAPVYRNAPTLPALVARQRRVLGSEGLSHEIVLIDDACPDGSSETISRLAARDPAIRLVSLDRNVGQHRAILAGLARSDAEWTVVMDADLQDPPEAIPALLAVAREGYSAVFAGRRGRYESRGRLATSRVFKQALHSLCGVPTDAGAFVALDRDLVNELVAVPGGGPSIVAMIGCGGRPLVSVPVLRARRPHGRSAYSSWRRLRSALGALGWVARRRLNGGLR